MAPAAEARASMSWGSIACAGAGAASVTSPTTIRTTATSWIHGVWRFMPPIICQPHFLSTRESPAAGPTWGGVPGPPRADRIDRGARHALEAGGAQRILAPPAAPVRQRLQPGRPLLLLARVDLHHGVQEPQRVVARPLERVAPDDGAEAAAVADTAALVEDRLVVLLGGPAREDHDAAPVEGGLHHVAHALAQRGHRHLGLLVGLLGLGLLDVLGGGRHLDDVDAELGR